MSRDARRSRRVEGGVHDERVLLGVVATPPQRRLDTPQHHRRSPSVYSERSEECGSGPSARAVASSSAAVALSFSLAADDADARDNVKTTPRLLGLSLQGASAASVAASAARWRSGSGAAKSCGLEEVHIAVSSPDAIAIPAAEGVRVDVDSDDLESEMVELHAGASASTAPLSWAIDADRSPGATPPPLRAHRPRADDAVSAASALLLRALPAVEWWGIHTVAAALIGFCDFSEMLALRVVCTTWREVIALSLWRAMDEFSRCRRRRCRLLGAPPGIEEVLGIAGVGSRACAASTTGAVTTTAGIAASAGRHTCEGVVAAIRERASRLLPPGNSAEAPGDATDGDNDGDDDGGGGGGDNSELQTGTAHPAFSPGGSSSSSGGDAAAPPAQDDALEALWDAAGISSLPPRTRRGRQCAAHSDQSFPLLPLLAKLQLAMRTADSHREHRHRVLHGCVTARLAPVIVPPLICVAIAAGIAATPSLREPVNDRSQTPITALLVLLITMFLSIACYVFARRAWCAVNLPTWPSSDSGPYPAALFSYGIAVLVGLMAFDIAQWRELLGPPPLAAGSCRNASELAAAGGDPRGAGYPPYVTFADPEGWTIDRDPARAALFQWLMVDSSWVWITRNVNESIHWAVPRVVCVGEVLRAPPEWHTNSSRNIDEDGGSHGGGGEGTWSPTSAAMLPEQQTNKSGSGGGDLPLKLTRCIVPLVSLRLNESSSGPGAGSPSYLVNHDTTNVMGRSIDGDFCSCSWPLPRSVAVEIDAMLNRTTVLSHQLHHRNARDAPRILDPELARPCERHFARVWQIPVLSGVQQISAKHQTVVKNWDSATRIRQFLSWRDSEWWRAQQLPLVTSATTPFDMNPIRMRAYTSIIIFCCIYMVFVISIGLRASRELKQAWEQWPPNLNAAFIANGLAFLRSIKRDA